MPHSAAVQSAPKAPLEVQDVETPQLGPHELLINNELIALVPIDAKLAKLAVFPIEYPAILGTSYGGTIAAVGSEVTNFKVGDKVAAVKTAGVSGNKYSAFQKYVVSRDVTASKVPESVDLHIPVGLIGNFSTIVGLFNEHLGLERPDPVNKVPSKGKTILIYGWIQSRHHHLPQHKDFVAKLGAVHVVDHTQSHDAVVKELVAQGPYDYVVDSISLKPTFDITAEVVAAQGGGKLYALLPPPEPSSIPKSVAAEFGSWSVPLGQEKNAELLKWAFGTYFTQAVTNDRIVALPSQKIDGGLGGLNKAVDVLFKGVSGLKVVVEP
ncbi:deshydrogenase mlcG [Colletotrichum liriopes]|uniref:Deshydrogenase mlcG n=1 Tax=Colletotrichum liriopes TaxID=708192 RepID=A0AA37LX54_9PEZI|nr:deshydrogenase mlcG [Colletotrichum liriopes]